MRRRAVLIGVLALGLLAARVGLSATDHRAPCHSVHSCPSDHHSYVWFDAAGQGWNCAKPGAPELTAADTQTIYNAGLRYLCHGAGGSHTPICGTEAWAQKTLSDPGALEVDLTARSTTIRALRRLSPPARLGTRMPGAEMHSYRIRVRLVWQKLETDSDVHLVVADPATGQTMIAELPSAECVGAAPAPAARMRAARTTLASYCGAPRTHFTRLHGTAVLEGVAFFDFEHGQRGRAPNLVELHPLLRVSPGRGRC